MNAHASTTHPAAGTPAIVALVYEDASLPEAKFAALVDTFRARGLRLAGLLQRSLPSGSERRCDVELVDLASGKVTPLLERRGASARGCRLDHAALTEATSAAMVSLADQPDLLVINKFGRAECEGGGARDLIAAAVLQGVPLVIGVPARNLPEWRNFVGDGAVEELLS